MKLFLAGTVSSWSKYKFNAMFDLAKPSFFLYINYNLCHSKIPGTLKNPSLTRRYLKLEVHLKTVCGNKLKSRQQRLRNTLQGWDRMKITGRKEKGVG